MVSIYPRIVWRLYGSVEADVARGLALRMDHGSHYLSDHLLNQLRYWGIHPSFGFLEEPETNGVVERWNRTLKEQAVYGRVFRNLADVRAAVAGFVERYNRCWRIARRSKRARNTSCVKPRSVNVCPRNRVRYTAMYAKRIQLTNFGPIEELDIKFPFDGHVPTGPRTRSPRLPRTSAPRI